MMLRQFLVSGRAVEYGQGRFRGDLLSLLAGLCVVDGVHPYEVEAEDGGDEGAGGGNDARQVVKVQRPYEDDFGAGRYCRQSASRFRESLRCLAQHRGNILLSSSSVELHVRFMMAIGYEGRCRRWLSVRRPARGIWGSRSGEKPRGRLCQRSSRDRREVNPSFCSKRNRGEQRSAARLPAE